jgi:signal transduction histidine kinase
MEDTVVSFNDVGVELSERGKIERDLEAGPTQDTTEPQRKTRTISSIIFSDDIIATTFYSVHFHDKQIEDIYREEFRLDRAVWGRFAFFCYSCLGMVLWGLSLSNNYNSSVTNTTAMLVIIPGILLLGMMIVSLSLLPVNERTLQLIWCVASTVMFAAVSVNQIVIQNSFPVSVLKHLEDVHDMNPILLFNITELGWFHTASLVFLAATIKPRFFFICVMTAGSFVTYTCGCYVMAYNLNTASILVRLLLYSVCCWFVLLFTKKFELNERRAWYLSYDLARKLRIEKDKLEKEALAKTEAERILVAYLCHEIRNPFNGVLGFAEMTVKLLEKLKGNKTATIDQVQREVSKVDAWCNNIIVSSKHIRDILDNVLDLSKLEAGTLLLSSQPIEISELVSELHLLLTPTMRTGVTFAIEVTPANLVIVGDRQRWKQLLVNLLSNAIKFTHEGEVKLQLTETEDRRLLVQVHDTGIGISDKEQSRLFQKYEQVKSNQEKGTGLGLVIAQRIATLLGSKIEIESPWSPGCRTSRSPNHESLVLLNTGNSATSTDVSRSSADGSAVEPVYVKVMDKDGCSKMRGTRFHFSVAGSIVDEADLPMQCEKNLVVEPELKDGLRFLVVDDDMLNRMIMCSKVVNSSFPH